MVEAAGVEPASEVTRPKSSTCIATGIHALSPPVAPGTMSSSVTKGIIYRPPGSAPRSALWTIQDETRLIDPLGGNQLHGWGINPGEAD